VPLDVKFYRRLIASVTAEIQQYQNEPYCLETNTEIQVSVDNLIYRGIELSSVSI